MAAHIMTARFVNLSYPDGKPVCAPIFVSLEGLTYDPTDIDFEEAALRFAIDDGLVRSRQEAIAEVRDHGAQAA